jgi:hypothetical protein
MFPQARGIASAVDKNGRASRALLAAAACAFDVSWLNGFTGGISGVHTHSQISVMKNAADDLRGPHKPGRRLTAACVLCSDVAKTRKCKPVRRFEI